VSQFRQNQPGAESWLSLQWDVPGKGRQPVSRRFQCLPWDGKLNELNKAMTETASPNPAQARAAQTLLREAGEVAAVLLRNAVRDAPAQTAAGAAAILADWRDKSAPPILLARLKSEQDAGLIRALKAQYAGRLCFHSAVDNQQTLPFGTPDDVRAEVKWLIEMLACDRTGFIVGPCHNLQPITPTGNILALYEAAREYGSF
jgi:hypothetical protein